MQALRRPPASHALDRAQTRRDFVVVVPAFDEEENVAPLFDALRAAFDAHGLTGGVVYVDDGSADGTYDAAVAAAARFGPSARVVRLRRNLGKTEAIAAGIAASTEECVIILDADLQFSPDAIPAFLDALAEGWDVVAGYKVGRYEKPLVSAMYNGMAHALFGAPVRDLNAMRAFRRGVADEVPQRHDWHRYFTVLAHARGFAITEVPVELHARRAGRAKYGSPARAFLSFVDLLVVWFYVEFSTQPMRLLGGTGVALFGGGALVGLYTGIRRALGIAPPPFGYRPLLGLVMLLLVAGLLLLGFGLVAEMIAILRTEVDELRRKH